MSADFGFGEVDDCCLVTPLLDQKFRPVHILLRRKDVTHVFTARMADPDLALSQLDGALDDMRTRSYPDSLGGSLSDLRFCVTTVAPLESGWMAAIDDKKHMQLIMSCGETTSSDEVPVEVTWKLVHEVYSSSVELQSWTMRATVPQLKAFARSLRLHIESWASN